MDTCEAPNTISADKRSRQGTSMLSPSNSVHFRSVLGQFASGVTVITGLTSIGEPVGFTCQSFTSVSLEPPLIAFCPTLGSRTYAAIRATRRFCVNVLGDHQEDLGRLFAGRDRRFSDARWHAGPDGPPRLDDALAWIDCRIDAEHTAGDHYVVIGRVESIGRGAPERTPLVFHRGAFSSLVSGRSGLIGWPSGFVGWAPYA
jgi:3-hydroxy-9,10-secoandrosta-1,3,5(10)-triene-9,17-dione monooxygenase reductase component